jgi:putative endonuclease
MKEWFVYIVECSDSTYYTGITTDIIKRIETHNSKKGAKYTRSRTPVTLKYSNKFENKSEASKEEYRIKQLTRLEKEQLWNCKIS